MQRFWYNQRVDLSQLLGGKAFDLPCSIIINGFSFDTCSLVDTGANGFLFIHSALVALLAQHCSATIHRFPKSIPVKGFNGQEATPITKWISLSFQIDRRRFLRIPFLVADIGRHDIIVGRKWLDYYNVDLGIRSRRLLWPTDLPPQLHFDRHVHLTKEIMSSNRINYAHQRDSDRRDANMAAITILRRPSSLTHKWPRSQLPRAPSLPVTTLRVPSCSSRLQKIWTANDLQALSSPSSAFLQRLRLRTQELGIERESLSNPPSQLVNSPSPPVLKKDYLHSSEKNVCPTPRKQPGIASHQIHTREALKTMERQLSPNYQSHVPPVRKVKRSRVEAISETAAIDIAGISAPAFSLNAHRPDNILFSTTLDEIDRILDRRQENPPLEDKQATDLLWKANTISAIDYREDEALVEACLKKWPQYASFKDVFSKRASDQLPPSRKNVDHKIELTQENNLRHSPLYRQTTEELRAVKEYLLENLDKGFIVPSNAPFASPVLFVAKPNGALRFCIDYRKLNSITKRDEHPLPLIDETLARISRAKIFTKLDIRQAFHRIRMDPASEELTTFRTRYGTFKCKVLPFGLTNGPATYQRYMNGILMEYLDDFCTAYLDDILIYSNDEMEHELHVKQVLQRLRDAGLQVDIKKTEFHVTRTKYLGFIVSTKGIEVDPEKVSAIVNWKSPNSVRGVQSFLGFCNFYRRFIKDYGRIAKPLINLTRKDVNFKFTADCEDAFASLQKCLISAPLLHHFQNDLETQVETDASDGVIAGVMSQLQHDGEWKPVGYFSKTMSPPELNYTIHDKEMLAIVKSFQQWRADLARTNSVVRVWTDHKALEYFMTTKQLNQRQARWAEVLAEFYFTIAYRSGKQNEKADTLTRREQDIEAQDEVKHANRTQTLLPARNLDPRIVAELSKPPPETIFASLEGFVELPLVDKILSANKTHGSLEKDRDAARRGDQDWAFKGNLLTWRGRLVVPETDDHLRTQLLKEVHDQVCTAHPGKSKTTNLVGRQYYWKGLRADVDAYINNCNPCNRSHVPRDRAPGFLHPLPVPERPWQHLTMDFKSFPSDKAGYDCLFVIMDRLSKSSVSIPCHKTINARRMAELFLTHVWRHEGFPDSIVSDRGPQFISSFWKEVCRILGIKIKLSTAFHPETDGQTEIMNQYIDQRLRPFVNHYQDNWSELIPMMDYAQRTLPHETIGMSPFELLKGYAPRTTWDWERKVDTATPREKLNVEQAQAFATRMHEAWKFAKANMKSAQEKKERDVNKHRRSVDFSDGDKVWVSTKNWKTDRPSRKLAEQMAGPYPITQEEGHSFRVGLPPSMKIHPVFHANILRKAASNPLPGQINEPEPPIHVTEDAEWEVQEIIAVQKDRYGNLHYRAKWVGHDDDPEYYPASDFKYSPHKLRSFHLENSKLPGPPASLSDWTKAWEDGIDDYDDIGTDKMASKSSRASFFQKGGVM